MQTCLNKNEMIRSRFFPNGLSVSPNCVLLAFSPKIWEHTSDLVYVFFSYPKFTALSNRFSSATDPYLCRFGHRPTGQHRPVYLRLQREALL